MVRHMINVDHCISCILQLLVNCSTRVTLVKLANRIFQISTLTDFCFLSSFPITDGWSIGKKNPTLTMELFFSVIVLSTLASCTGIPWRYCRFGPEHCNKVSHTNILVSQWI